jgi:beta-lactamase class A
VSRSFSSNSPQSLQQKVPAAKKGHRLNSVELPPRPKINHQAVNQVSRQVKASQGIKPKSVKVPRQSPQRKRQNTPILCILRLLILGIGVGAIAGTLLSVLDPATRLSVDGSETAIQETQQNQTSVVQPSALKLSQELLPLKTVVQSLAAKNALLMPGVFFVDLDNGAYIDLNGSSVFSAASMIKVPVLVAFFQDVDAGKIRLDELLTLKQELIGGGSGDMQYKPVGTKFTALETATKMIVISDNTATNMLIARMGGAAALNQRFQSWGMSATEIRNLLPDLSGTNTTSPRDLGQLMALVNQGDLMSLRSRDRLLEIMRRTKTKTLLPRGLGQGATIAHKTGDIGSMVGDVGLVDMPNGKRYIGVAMVKRPHNDNRAQELIRQISRAAYQEFNKPTVIQIMPTTPFVTKTQGEGR